MSLKQAVEQARKYLVDLYGDVPGIRLEEVESSDGRWDITLSFLTDGDGPLSMRLLTPTRQYKIFNIDKNTGNISAMRIRQINA